MNQSCPHRRKVLVDASSAILLFKADLFEPLINTYAVQMAASVFTEVTRKGYAGAEFFSLCRDRLKIRVIARISTPHGNSMANTKLPGHLGPGERDTILLFGRGAGDFIIIDDGRGAAWCRDHKIPYINALLFPRILQAGNILGKETCYGLMSRIVGIGRYSTRIIAYARSCDARHLQFFLP